MIVICTNNIWNDRNGTNIAAFNYLRCY